MGAGFGKCGARCKMWRVGQDVRWGCWGNMKNCEGWAKCDGHTDTQIILYRYYITLYNVMPYITLYNVREGITLHAMLTLQICSQESERFVFSRMARPRFPEIRISKTMSGPSGPGPHVGTCEAELLLFWATLHFMGDCNVRTGSFCLHFRGVGPNCYCRQGTKQKPHYTEGDHIELIKE